MLVFLLNNIFKKAVGVSSAIVLISMFFMAAPDAHAFGSQKEYENYVTDENGLSYLGDADSCSTLNKFVNLFNSNRS